MYTNSKKKQGCSVNPINSFGPDTAVPAGFTLQN